MREILEPLARIPGVRSAVLHSTDGVPIAVRGSQRSGAEPTDERSWVDTTEDLDALAGLAAGWLAEVTRSVAPLTWNAPRRLIMQASRGTLILVSTPGAVLLVLLERGMRAEELRLPMEGAVTRMDRILRSMGEKQQAGANSTQVDSVPGALPTRSTSENSGADEVRLTGNEVPELSGE